MIEETISLFTESPHYSPSSGDNLMGMEYDIDHCFESSKVFSLTSMNSSGGKECMFNITVGLSEGVNELHHVRHALQEVWEFIQYGYFEASSVIIGPKSAHLRFVTAIGENQFYVTGKITVVGAVYERLAKNA